VHDEDVQEGGERSKKDFLMLFFSETGLHLLREATDLFVGSNALLLLVRNLSPPPTLILVFVVKVVRKK
jgi:hypothetical protein